MMKRTQLKKRIRIRVRKKVRRKQGRIAIHTAIRIKKKG
jgi:hypothetical protein